MTTDTDQHAPTDEEAEKIREIERWREKRKLWTLNNLVKAIDRYRAELERDTPGHLGRLGKWEGMLCEAIERTHEAFNPGPIRQEDLEETEVGRRLRERGEMIARGEWPPDDS